MVTKVRLIAVLGAVVAALVIVAHNAPPTGIDGAAVQLRFTAEPLAPATTMKSPIIATTDPRPFDACADIPFDAIQRLGLAYTPPQNETLMRCHYDAGNYQLAVETIVWRGYAETLPADAVETTVNGHRVAQYWVLKPTGRNSYYYNSCMVTFKTSYGVIQQSLYYSTIYSNPDVDCMRENLMRAEQLSPYYIF